MVPENTVAEQAVRKGNVSTGDRRRQRAQNAVSANRGGSTISGKANAQHKQRNLGKRVVQYGTRRTYRNGNAEEHRKLLGAERIGAAAFFTVGVLSFTTSIACRRCQRFRAAAHKRANHHQQHRNAKHAQARLIATERKRQQHNRPNKGNRLANSPNAPDQACGQHRTQKRERVRIRAVVVRDAARNEGRGDEQNRRSILQASVPDAKLVYQRNNAQRKQGNGDCGSKDRRAQPKLSTGSKQQAPTPQANIPSMRNKASVSIGVAQRNNRIGVRKAVQVHLRMADHTHRKAHHQQFCVASKPELHLGKPRFLCR